MFNSDDLWKAVMVVSIGLFAIGIVIGGIIMWVIK